MATTKEITILPSIDEIDQNDYNYELEDIALCDNPNCPICSDVGLQCDSVHSEALQKAIGMGASGADALGFSGAGNVIRDIGSVSGAIGKLLGVAGILDQPSMIIHQEAAQPVVDIPQPVRSLYFKKADSTGRQHKMFSGSAGMQTIKQRCRVPALIDTISWSTAPKAGTKLTPHGINIAPQTARVMPDNTIDSNTIS